MRRVGATEVLSVQWSGVGVVPSITLRQIASTASNSYRLAKPIVKPDGSIRRPFDALPSLKAVHRRLKYRILEHVWFPDYLTGSLKGKDARRNAALHAGAKIVVTEDIKDFFPTVSAAVVHSIWLGFFGFGEEVADILTILCTKDGVLPQGAIPSSYLANLACWDQEWKLFEDFSAKEITYSRYVDDVTFSSQNELSRNQLTNCIRKVYGFMAAKGFRPKRQKQEIRRAHAPMTTTKLLVNRRPALLTQQRQNIRAAVHQLELEELSEISLEQFKARIQSISGRVGRLAQLHPTEGKALKERIAVLKHKLIEASNL